MTAPIVPTRRTDPTNKAAIAALANSPVSLPVYRILEALRVGECLTADLPARSGQPKGTQGKWLRVAEDKGFIARKQRPGDKPRTRVCDVRLTDKGKVALAHATALLRRAEVLA